MNAETAGKRQTAMRGFGDAVRHAKSRAMLRRLALLALVLLAVSPHASLSRRLSLPVGEGFQEANVSLLPEASPGFYVVVNITQPNDTPQFYFMELSEIMRRVEAQINWSVILACRTLAGKVQNDAFKAHESRVPNISQADVLILEIGDDREGNWPVYQHTQHAFINRGQHCDRTKFFEELNKLYQSDYINRDVWDANPQLKHVLVMDIVNEIELKPQRQNDTKFIFFGVRHEEKMQHFDRMITVPPPLMRKSEQHHIIKPLNTTYLVAFQGDCTDRQVVARRRVAELQKLTPHDDVFIHCNGGKGKTGASNMLDVIASAQFALDLPGDQRWTYRFAEIMHVGTILMRIDEPGDRWELPFSHLINWDRVAILRDTSILKNESVWDAELSLLRSMPQEKYTAMKVAMRNVVENCFQTWEKKIHCLLMDLNLGYMQ